MRKAAGLCRDTGRLVVVVPTMLVVCVTVVVPPMLVVAVEVAIVERRLASTLTLNSFF